MAKVNKRRGNWQATVRGPDGREVTKTFPKRVQADQWAKEREADKLRGSWVNPRAGRETFEKWVERYLDAGATHKRATTLARTRAVLNHWFVPVLGKRAIGSITPHDVRTIVESMVAAGKAPRTVRSNYGVLRAAMSAAVDAELIAVSPCRGVKLPEIPKVAKPVARVSDVHRLADAIAAEYRPAIYLGSLGLREAEVFGLRVKAIDFLRKTLTVEETVNEVEGQLIVGDGKTRSSVRTISVPDSIVDVLAQHLRQRGRRKADYLLQAPDGGPVRANTSVSQSTARSQGAGVASPYFPPPTSLCRASHEGDRRAFGGDSEASRSRQYPYDRRCLWSLSVAVDKAAWDRLNKMYESSRGHFADMDEGQASA